MTDTIHGMKLQAVANINGDLYEKTGMEYIQVSIITNIFVTQILFLDIQIWGSEDNGDRIYDEEKDCYEPIETYLRRCIKNEILYMAKFI